MSTKVLVTIALMSAGWIIPLHGQSRMALNIGGGMTTPLNPTGAFTGIGGNFNKSRGYNVHKKNTIFGRVCGARPPAGCAEYQPRRPPPRAHQSPSLTS